MAKETNVNEVVQLLQDAQQNKELVEAMGCITGKICIELESSITRFRSTDC
ncbi:hypothetical protein [Adhaeribacter rhizoryzae]|uniref:hypothetical protein n=1 Tax=Adhaeribacter rhizoryzae TaxID=2607907 RepID=UPI00167FE043|nr:hypothetical protein [Adhaeribacter rhizoryzae]